MFKATAVRGDGTADAADAVVVGFFSDGKGVVPAARPLDRSLKGALSAPVKYGDLRGKAGEVQTLYLSGRKNLKRAILLGLGERGDLDTLTLRGAAGNAGRLARKLKLKRVRWLLHPLRGKDGLETAARVVTEGFHLGSYRAFSYGKKGGRKATMRSLILEVDQRAKLPPVRAGLQAGLAVSNGVWLARDLINRPGNRLTPAVLAAEARMLARAAGLGCKVVKGAELKRLGAGGILAVGQGSIHPPCLIQLTYKAPRAGAPNVFVVGKGITFDTGGISIKPAHNMEKMNNDMGGAGAVLGIMSAVNAMKLPVNVTGIIASAENMPGGRAYKPGDVITQLDGTTVEVINTDAEGRIVLGDALAYAVRKKPDAIVDLATLTGSCAIALGSQAMAMLSNDNVLAKQMDAAGVESGERVWRLPLWKQYKPLMASDVADLKNTGSREAGTITAAIFLEKFVGGYPWVHLDIASTAWSDSDRDCRSKGGTGVGVAVVARFLAAF